MKNGIHVVVMLVWLAAGGNGVWAAEAGAKLTFKEVHDLVREHLGGIDDAELEDAAARGLIEQLHPRVSLVAAGDGSAGTGSGEVVLRKGVYDESFGYIRVGRVAPGLPEGLSQAVKDLAGSNELRGLILDLRYVVGLDYGAAAAAADLFFAVERPLIDYGEGMKTSTAKEDAVILPLAVLVNGETAGAAEALAGILREGGVALVLGQTTAGHAGVTREFDLAGGQKLRIATAAVRLGKGTLLDGGGITPDIEVGQEVAAARSYYEDAYADLEGEPGLEMQRRLNEAELVRRRREPNLELPVVDKGVVEKPILRDPVLGRALDLLKGIAVVKRYRPD